MCAGKGMLMAAGSRTWAGGTHPAEVFSPQPSSPRAAEEEPLGSLAADGYVLAIPSPAGQYLSQRCPQMSFQATEDSWLCSLAVPQQSCATAGIAVSCALKAINNHSLHAAFPDHNRNSEGFATSSCTSLTLYAAGAALPCLWAGPAHT